jgi:hypothetical protein
VSGWGWVLIGFNAFGGILAVASYITARRYRAAIVKSHRRVADVSDSPLHQVAIGLGLDRPERTRVTH